MSRLGSKSGCFWHGVGNSEPLLTTSNFRSNHSQCENLNPSPTQLSHSLIFSSIQIHGLKFTLYPLHITNNQKLPEKKTPSAHIPSSWVKRSPHSQFRKEKQVVICTLKNSRMRKLGSKSSCCKTWIRDAETCSPLPIAEASDRLYKEETQIHTWEGADGWVAGTAGQCGSMELRWAAPNCRRCAAHPNSWMQQRHSHHFPWKPCKIQAMLTSRSLRSLEIVFFRNSEHTAADWAGQLGQEKKKTKKGIC